MVKEYKVKSTEDVFDIAINTVGIDGLMQLINDSDLDTIDIDFEGITGVSLSYTPVPSNLSIDRKKNAEESPIRFLRTNAGQSIYDIALMTYGSLDFVMELIESNLISNINEPVASNLNLNFLKDSILDLSLFNTIQNRKLIYNTDEEFEDFVDPVDPDPVGVFDFTFEYTFN